MVAESAIRSRTIAREVVRAVVYKRPTICYESVRSEAGRSALKLEDS